MRGTVTRKREIRIA